MPMQTWKLYNVEAMDFNLFFSVDNTSALYDSMPEYNKADFKMLWQVKLIDYFSDARPFPRRQLLIAVSCLCSPLQTAGMTTTGLCSTLSTPRSSRPPGSRSALCRSKSE